jgi:sugar fermentation stimulation protein A
VRFLERPNRYLARVARWESPGELVAHVPNPGRMTELLRAGRTEGWAIPVPGRTAGRTLHDLVAVRHGRTLVSIDSRIANRLVGRVLAAGGLPALGGGAWSAEPRWRNSRFDFGQRRADGGWAGLLEVKSSNLRLGRWASFPDAPTERGTRHLRELARSARSGIRAHVLFAVQRGDVRGFHPNARMDPEFAEALAGAHAAGVRVSAHTMVVRPGRVGWGRPLPVRLLDPRPRLERTRF